MHRFNPENHKRLDDTERLKWQDPMKIIDWLELDGTEAVADIGSGTGFIALRLGEKYPKATVFGVDVSDKMGEILVQRAGEKGLTNILFVKTDGRLINLENASADILFMVNILHEVDTDYGLVDECRRILKPGGRMVVVDWRKDLTPVGPPVEERISESEADVIMADRGFSLLAGPELYPHHYTLVFI